MLHQGQDVLADSALIGHIIHQISHQMNGQSPSLAFLKRSAAARDLNGTNLIASTNTCGAKAETFNVRLWLEADIPRVARERPLYPQKRTFKS